MTMNGTDMNNGRMIEYRQALNEAMAEEMRDDGRVFVMGIGVGARGGSFKVTKGLLDEFGPKRVIDTPIAEASYTGMAIGAAIAGMRPVVELLFVDFSILAIDQLVNQAAKYRFITGGERSVPLVMRTQGGVGDGLGVQHSQSLEALFYHIPGLMLFTPSSPSDAKGLLKAAIRLDRPVVFMEHKRLYGISGPVHADDHVIEPGRADVKRRGRDVTIVAWSGMVERALAAADSLAADGIEAEIVDPRTLVPLDTDTILASVEKTGFALIVQEAVRRGGVASDISSLISERMFDYLEAPVTILAGKNTPIPYNRTLEQSCIPQVDDIVAEVRRLLS